ncbi:uncharacterized protein MEPE_02949 [Melanopsichium pennsylvanicum]|uniref:Uncharacterized protein n=1 Tax=Melanopsichium pennsylvanicum TaxID=63383 RepID=A0AAJ5C504_9BASI|nr:uncharacterized protein MEPE_02949 [Melanopsichium pennsylvanicum]
MYFDALFIIAFITLVARVGAILEPPPNVREGGEEILRLWKLTQEEHIFRQHLPEYSIKFQNAWKTFLKDQGATIIQDHYKTQLTNGEWQFKDYGMYKYPIKLQAALLLIERFAEHRKNVGNVFPQEAHIGANMPWRSTQGNTAAWIKGDEADTADSKAAEWKEWGNSLQIVLAAEKQSHEKFALAKLARSNKKPSVLMIDSDVQRNDSSSAGTLVYIMCDVNIIEQNKPLKLKLRESLSMQKK